MNKALSAALGFGALIWAAPAAAQQPSVTQVIDGTRLDVTATGEVTRVPDVAVISAGVVTRAPTASAAIQDAAARMQKVLTALRRAGVDERDIQTGSIGLSPEYRYPENQAPQLVAYSASNQLTIKFREIRDAGKILDALVSEGANQINGPTLAVDKPEQALDEARAKAIAIGRARAELYARSLGLHVVRTVAVSESGGYAAPPPAPPVPMMAAESRAFTKIEPGEQKLQVTLAMTFELK